MENYRFFGSAEGDVREYNQTEFAEFVRSLQDGNGYLVGRGGELAVTSQDPEVMAVNVATGDAMVEGYYYKNDDTISVNINPASAQPRIDRIVLRLSVVDLRPVSV